MNSTGRRVLRGFVVFAAGAIWSVAAIAAGVWVMPDQYAYLVTAYGLNDDTRFGSLSGKGWDQIRLWGKCDAACAGGYQYRWRYGYNNASGSEVCDPWQNVTISNYRNLQSITTLTSLQYPVAPTDEGIRTYRATLEIRHVLTGAIEDESLIVSAVDFSAFTAANGFTDPLREKRAIVEQIAEGRALRWLYLKQDSTKGNSWPAVSDGNVVNEGATALAMTVFSVYGHHDPAENDIFYDCLPTALEYLLGALEHVPAVNDTNGNSYMIKAKDTCHLPAYVLGTSMLALAVFKNSLTQSTSFYVSGHLTSYQAILEDMVEYAAWAQNDGPYLEAYPYINVSQGSWEYDPNAGRADLSVTSWIVLGLDAIEENWGITAPASVRNNLREYLTCIQFQAPGSSFAVPLDDRDGAARYHYAHERESTYAFNKTDLYSNPWLDGDERNRMDVHPDMENSCDESMGVGTASVLLMAHYLGRNTSGAVAICGCGAARCSVAGTDCTLSKSDYNNSCYRIRGAINYLGRAQNMAERLYTAWGTNTSLPLIYNASTPGLYSMYTVKKALQLLAYTKYSPDNPAVAGINGGVLPTCSSGEPWQDLYSTCLLKKQYSDGSFPHGGEYYVADDVLTTELALLILPNNVFTAPVRKVLRTDLRPDLRHQRLQTVRVVPAGR